MKRIAMKTLGTALLVIGLVTTPLPPPFAMGALLTSMGLAILIVYSTWVRGRIRALRERWPPVNRLILAIQNRAPRGVRVPLRITDPERSRKRRAGRTLSPAQHQT